MIEKKQVLKHKHTERYIQIVAVEKIRHLETGKEEMFCSFYWLGYNLIGSDLLTCIERDYMYYGLSNTKVN